MFIKTPCSIVVFSPSMSGKTTLILEILKNKSKYFDVEIFEVIYHYNIWSDQFSNQKGIKFIQGDEIELPTDNKPRILIIDDLLQSKKAQKSLVQIFTVEGHHLNISCIFATQELFVKELKTVSANAKIFFLSGGKRNFKSVRTLFSQMDYDLDYLKSAYRDATKDENEYNFFMIDLQKKISPELQIGSKVLDRFPTFYLPTDNKKRSPIPVTYKITHG